VPGQGREIVVRATTAILSLALLLGGTAQVSARQQQAGQEHAKQKPTPEAMAEAAAQIKVFFNGLPHFAMIEGTSFSYATNSPREVIRSGDIYYLCSKGIWFVAMNVQGPWEAMQFVPTEIAQIVCAQLGPFNPFGNYQLCALPAPDLTDDCCSAVTK
jgi:hypothetical protein